MKLWKDIDVFCINQVLMMLQTITMNVAHRALQKNWIYLIFFSVVTIKSYIVSDAVYELFCLVIYFLIVTVGLVPRSPISLTLQSVATGSKP